MLDFYCRTSQTPHHCSAIMPHSKAGLFVPDIHIQAQRWKFVSHSKIVKLTLNSRSLILVLPLESVDAGDSFYVVCLLYKPL